MEKETVAILEAFIRAIVQEYNSPHIEDAMAVIFAREALVNELQERKND